MTDTADPFAHLRRKDLSRKVLSPDEKTWIASQVVANNTTAAKAANKYNLKRKNITYWVNILKSGRVIQPHCGRPPTLDTEAIRKVLSAVTVTKEQPRAISRSQFCEVVVQEAQKTQQRRNTGQFFISKGLMS